MLRVVTDHRTSAELVSSLEEIVREGSQDILSAALEAEADRYVSAFADQVDQTGRRLVVRNGYADARQIATRAGPVEVRAPRVNDRRVDQATGQRLRFTSSIMPPWAGKAPQLAQALPLMYLRQVTSKDLSPDLEDFFRSAPAISTSLVAALDAPRRGSLRPFFERSLAEADYLCLWADALDFNPRCDESRVPALVIIGIGTDETRELVSFSDGRRDCIETWANVLRDLRRRGLVAPPVAVGAESLGFWGALSDVFPEGPKDPWWSRHSDSLFDGLPQSAQLTARRAAGQVPWRGAGAGTGVRPGATLPVAVDAVQSSA